MYKGEIKSQVKATKLIKRDIHSDYKFQRKMNQFFGFRIVVELLDLSHYVNDKYN